MRLIPPVTSHRRLTGLAALATAAVLAAAPAQAVNVLTRQYDNNRTGANTSETTLTTANVNQSQFGKLWSYTVDGQVYTQPLIVQGVTIGGVSRTVMYVGTMHNTLYAFDANGPSTAPLWSVSLGTPLALDGSQVGTNCGSYRDIFYEAGILSTPVIDLATNTIYVSNKSTGYVDRLHALDLATGAEKMGGPVTIQATLNGRTLNGQFANQRTSLVLANGRVHVGFGGYCDTGTYYGWYLGYSASNLGALPLIFNAGFDGSAAPVWMAGSAAPVDASGNLYVMTGNGTFNAPTGGQSYGETFLKLSPTLSVLDYFTPYNYDALNSVDADLGSSGPILVPGTTTILGGGKESMLYLTNTGNMGHTQAGSNSQIMQSFKAGTGHIHGTPVYWNGPNGPMIYMMAETDALKAYQFSGSTLNTTPFSQSTVKAPSGSMPGGLLSLSANGGAANTGIVWDNMAMISDANQGIAFGVLRAFNAQNLTQELWNSQQNPNRDAFGLLAKFVPPTIANGKVYMPSFSKQVAVYGLLGSVPTPAPTAVPTIPASGNLALGKYATGSDPCAMTEGGEKATNGSVTGGNPDKFCTKQTGFLHLIVDLGTTYNVNSFTIRHAGAGGEAAALDTKDFNIQLSTDFNTWNTVATVTGNTADVTTHPITAQNARYARINVTTPSSSGDAAMRIYEFEVYGAGTTTPTPTRTSTPTATATATPTIAGTNLALNKPASASSTESATFPASAAFDGDATTTRWSSAFADPQWLSVDLGATYNVNRVRLVWEAAYASQYTVQVSGDNVNWTTIKTQTAGVGGTEDWTGLSGSGRYVRMNGTARGSAFGYSVFELEVYGTAGATPTSTATATRTPTATATTGSTPTFTSTATRTATPTATPTNSGSATTVNLSSAFNVNAAYSDGTTFSATGGIDGVGSAFSSNLLGSTFSWSGTTFNFGAANALNGARNVTITLPSGQYSTLLLLATGLNGDQASQTVRVNYSDGTNSTFTQTFSNWLNANQVVTGQSIASSMAYRNKSTGVKDNRAFNLYGYSFALNNTRVVTSLVLPATNNVVVLAATLRTTGGATPTSTATATRTATATATTVGATATSTATRTNTPTATATTTATPTPTTGGGACAGVPAFQTCTAYASGASVVFNNIKWHSIAPIPSTRDCPPNSPFDPSNDNWWVNDGGC